MHKSIELKNWKDKMNNKKQELENYNLKLIHKVQK